MKQLKHKIISVLVAIVLIILIGVIAFGGKISESIKNGEEINARWFLALLYPERYSYSVQTADLNEYYQLFSQDDIAIVLQNERIEDRGKYIDGTVYFAFDTVERLFTDRFYVNEEEGVLLYTTSTDVITVEIGDESTGYSVSGTYTATDYPIARYYEDCLYVAAEYVRQYANFSYDFYTEPNRMQVYTEWGTRREAEILNNTQVRYQGGIKSDILREISAGEKVTVLEIMETWTQVKTNDGYIGYVENTMLSDYAEVTDTPVTGAYSPEEDYGIPVSGNKITMVFHQIYSPDDGSGLNELLTSTSGIDVVSPTWFYINSETGTFDSLASAAYVENAHAKGLQVWALVEDMTNDFDEYALFASSTNRRAFIDNLITATMEVGADGINVDCEEISRETGPHYVQFLRELAIETRKNGLILSVDNYVRNEGNLYYDLGEQGIVADYVIVMGYDEHWAGSDAGSVASIDFVERGITSALDSGVPAQKLINGVPFYTRIWRTEGVETNSEAVGMTAAANWAETRGITPVWDEETCQYYVSHQDGTALYQIWIEDAESLATKLTVMNNYGIAGMAAWKLGLESEDVWPIINAHME